GKITAALGAALGATPEEAAKYGQAAGQLYAQGYGQSFAEVSTAIEGVVSTLGKFGSQGELEAVTRKAMDVASAFGLDVQGAVTYEHEVSEMRALAERYSDSYAEFSNISPTIYSGAETLPSQSAQFLRERKPFTGCGAGHTHFHVDPHGSASICKVGRDPNVSLVAEGIEGLRKLGGIADSLMLRTGGCSGCQLSESCFTCRPLAKLYQEAKSPLDRYCQHGRK
ncbi:MAG: hypothetical protein ABW215_06600, partial [Kibdelosporangium sp.]